MSRLEFALDCVPGENSSSSEFVCLCGNMGNDLWFSCVAFLVIMVWLFVPCLWSQLSLTLAKAFKAGDSSSCGSR